MSSAMRSLRIRAKNESFHKSAENVVNKLCVNPGTPVRVSTKLAKHILIMHDTLTAHGRLHTTQVKNVGAGVKEIYLKEMTI